MSRRLLLQLGCLGAVLTVIGSYGAGALPASDPTSKVPVLSALRWTAGDVGIGTRVALLLVYAGVVLLCGCWLMVGARLLGRGPALRPEPAAAADSVSDRHDGPLDVNYLRRMALGWALPLIAAAPLFSRDLYAYAAQAQIAAAGLDPYSATPADLPGRFLDEVAWRWVDAPAPYGPLWLDLGRLVGTVVGEHVLFTIIGVRLLAVAGVALVAWHGPALATRLGGRGEIALWLAVLNPLVLFHGIAGGHNDALMMGFVVAGFAALTARGAPLLMLAVGSALITCGAAIKSPAAIALAFALPLWMSRHPRRRPADAVAGALTISAVSLGSFGAMTFVSGFGFGWIDQVNASVPVVNWLSLPTSLGLLWRELHGVGVGRALDSTVEGFRIGGTIATLVILAALWAWSWRGKAMALCAVGFAVTALLGPSVQPWYYLWALTLAAVCVRSARVTVWLALLSLILALHTEPQGSAITTKWIPFTATVLGASVAVWATFWRREADGHTGEHDPGEHDLGEHDTATALTASESPAAGG